MKTRLGATYASALASLSLSMVAYGTAATLVTVEPDNYPHLTPLTNVVPGVTLSLGNQETIDPTITIVSLSEHGIPSTGSSYFGGSHSGGFGALFFVNGLRADFDSPAQAVSIDFIGCCNVSGDPLTIGKLGAFDSSGNLVDLYTTAALARGVVERATVATRGFRIAYVVAAIAADANGSNGTYLDHLVFAARKSVRIDVKPGSDKNSINPRARGLITVSIPSTTSADGDSLDFDALQIDPLSVQFGVGEATEAHGRSHVADVDRDGDADLVLHFSIEETDFQCGDSNVELIGETFAGEAIAGADSIRTVGCH